jgi:hypothetical protein
LFEEFDSHFVYKAVYKEREEVGRVGVKFEERKEVSLMIGISHLYSDRNRRVISESKGKGREKHKLIKLVLSKTAVHDSI